jgi:hypothetical protein
VDLTEFTQLDDDDAESLGRHESDLSLEGLTSLSDVAAESLRKVEDLSVWCRRLRVLVRGMAPSSCLIQKRCPVLAVVRTLLLNRVR